MKTPNIHTDTKKNRIKYEIKIKTKTKPTRNRKLNGWESEHLDYKTSEDENASKI